VAWKQAWARTTLSPDPEWKAHCAAVHTGLSQEALSVLRRVF
jgi:hypothetical protein